jgi:hypothetical protein
VNDADRFRLRFGPYKTPRVKRGQIVRCEVRGEVRIVSLSDAPIPWPIGWRARGRPSLVVFKDLAKAVRRESNIAVAHWFGVTAQTVTVWRKAFAVGPINEGTHELLAGLGKERIEDSLPKAYAKARDSERCRKISEAHKGKPKPRHVIEALRRGRTGKPHSEEVRRKISEANKRRGAWPPAAGRPWTEEEEELLQTLPVAEMVRRTGRTNSAVRSRRRKLRRSGLALPDGRRRD